MPIVWLIRHAKAGSRGEHGANDLLRPLSRKGIMQAMEIAKLLGRKKIKAIYSSEARRCVDTVSPLAESLRLEVMPETRFTEGNAFELPDEDRNLVICAHGDNIPALLSDLGLDAWKCSKGSIWEIEHDGQGQILRSEYLDGPNVS